MLNMKIMLICMINHNIGNNLTNYALYRYLKDCGHDVQIYGEPIDTPMGEWLFWNNDGFLADTLPYDEGDLHSLPVYKWEIYKGAQKSEICITGSDQIWRDIFVKETGYHTLGAWMPAEIRKISYGSSFGINFLECDAIGKLTYNTLLKRFSALSVREESGKRLLNVEFDLEAEVVLDSVFLPEKKEFDYIAELGDLTSSKKYVGAYLLDIDRRKENVVLSCAASLTNGEYIAYSDTETKDFRDCKLTYNNATLSVANWLRMIRDSEYVITDSFHGVCFCLIYRKQFVVIFDKDNWRGKTRIEYLLRKMGITERFLHISNSWDDSIWKDRIDYTPVEIKLNDAKLHSKNWINEYIKCNDTEKIISHYDNYLLAEYKRHIDEEAKLKMIGESIIRKYAEQAGMTNAPEIVGWGAGQCFWQNIIGILKYVNINRIYDKNLAKWKCINIANGISVLNPEEMHCWSEVIVIVFTYDACSTTEIICDLMNKGAKCVIHAIDFIKNLTQMPIESKFVLDGELME